MALRFGTVAVNAVTGIVTARALNPSGRGELAAMVLWPMLFAGLTTCGLPAALVYYMRSEPRQAGAFVGWALLLSTLSAIAGTAIGWQLIPIWLSHHPPEVIRGAQFCLLTTLLCALTLTARAGWEARGEFVRSSLSQVVTPLCVLAALGLLSWRGALTPTAAAAAYVLAGLPSLFWIVTALARHARPTLDGGRALWGRLSHYGLRSYGVDLCGILAVYLDQALVVGLLSAASMGIYAVALSLSRVITAVHACVATIVFPRAVGLAPEAMAAAVGRSARMGTLVSGRRRPGGPGRRTGLADGALRAGLRTRRVHPAAPGRRGDRGRAGAGAAAGVPRRRPAGRRHDGAGAGPDLQRAAVPGPGARPTACGGRRWRCWAARRCASSSRCWAYRSIRLPAPRVLITGDDLVDIGRYRGALVSSITRLRASGGVE